MKKVAIFGDCQTSRVWEHHRPEEIDFELKMWGKGGINAIHFDPNKFHKENIISSGVEVHRPDMNWETVVTFEEVEESDIILLWIGYVDIRQWLPKYKNADEVAKNFVESAISYFKNKTIRFIEPLPQFVETIMKYEGLHEKYSYEERLEQNEAFIESLRKYCKENNLMSPVSQKDIYDAIGENKLTASMTHNFAPHPVDGLKPEYNKKIYDLFIKSIEEMI